MTYQPFPAFADWPVVFDPTLVDQYADHLGQVRESATPEAQAKAREITTRYAAVDTGAIEGLYTTDRDFTKTVATRSEHWRQALDLRGQQVKRSIGDALDGYDYVLDAVTRATPITAKWIRQLHAVITKHQETYNVVTDLSGQLMGGRRPLPHGEYKTMPNNPTNASAGRLHDYAPPLDTSAEMIRLCDELVTGGFAAAHPVVQAAFAHYGYVCIHPFADGNGRVARALASVFLYRAFGVPLVIFADQRAEYIDALERADDGDPRDFIGFMQERVIDAVQLATLTMAEPRPVTDKIQGTIARIEEVDNLGLAVTRLAGLAASRLRDALDDCNLPVGFSATVSQRSVTSNDGTEYIPHRGNDEILVQLSQASEANRVYVALGRKPGSPGSELLLRRGEDNFDIWLREIDPAETASLGAKLNAWAKNEVVNIVKELDQPPS